MKLSVGSWPSRLSPGAVAPVLYSLLQSRNPVVRVVVKFNGVEQGVPLTASDLRNAAGSYFTATTVRGSYLLTVEAFDATGCSDGGASRPMTVNVK